MMHATRAIKKGFANHQALAAVLEAIYKGEKEDLIKEPMFDGFSYYKPIEPVTLFTQCFDLSEQGFIFLISSLTYLSRTGGDGSKW